MPHRRQQACHGCPAARIRSTSVAPRPYPERPTQRGSSESYYCPAKFITGHSQTSLDCSPAQVPAAGRNLACPPPKSCPKTRCTPMVAFYQPSARHHRVFGARSSAFSPTHPTCGCGSRAAGIPAAPKLCTSTRCHTINGIYMGRSARCPARECPGTLRHHDAVHFRTNMPAFPAPFAVPPARPPARPPPPP